MRKNLTSKNVPQRIMTSKVVCIAYGIGPKVIERCADASSKELVKKLYQEFLALKGVNFFMLKSYVCASQINEIMDGSVCMTTLKAKKLVVKFSSSKYFSAFSVQRGCRKIFSFSLPT